MKKFLLFLCFICLLFSCQMISLQTNEKKSLSYSKKLNDMSVREGNIIPLVTIVSDGYPTIRGGSPLTINTIVSDLNGTITNVEFYVGTNLIGKDLTNPYSYIWSNPFTGNTSYDIYDVGIKAYDNLNGIGTYYKPFYIFVMSKPIYKDSLQSPFNTIAITQGTISYVSDNVEGNSSILCQNMTNAYKNLNLFSGSAGINVTSYTTLNLFAKASPGTGMQVYLRDDTWSGTGFVTVNLASGGMSYDNAWHKIMINISSLITTGDKTKIRQIAIQNTTANASFQVDYIGFN